MQARRRFPQRHGDLRGFHHLLECLQHPLWHVFYALNDVHWNLVVEAQHSKRQMEEIVALTVADFILRQGVHRAGEKHSLDKKSKILELIFELAMLNQGAYCECV